MNLTETVQYEVKESKAVVQDDFVLEIPVIEYRKIGDAGLVGWIGQHLDGEIVLFSIIEIPVDKTVKVFGKRTHERDSDDEHLVASMGITSDPVIIPPEIARLDKRSKEYRAWMAANPNVTETQK